MDLPYTFKILHGGTFTTRSSYGLIELDHFSAHCVVQEMSEERYYWFGVFFMGPLEYRQIHFTVAWDDDAHITVSFVFSCWMFIVTVQFQVIKSHYEAKQAVLGPEQSFMFKDDAITLDIPKNGKTKNKWKVNPTIQPKVIHTLSRIFTEYIS